LLTAQPPMGFIVRTNSFRCGASQI